MTGYVDFGRLAIGSDKGRVKLSALDSVIFSVKVDFAFCSPKTIADCQEFLGSGVSFVVRKKIAVTVLLGRRTAGDNIQVDPSADQCRKRVHLLDKSWRLHQSRSIRGYELEARR